MATTKRTYTRRTPKPDVGSVTTTAAEPVEATVSRSETRPILRETVNAWWCPFDGGSMPLNLSECAFCGATREGAKATRKA